jgi:hypothetical protein
MDFDSGNVVARAQALVDPVWLFKQTALSTGSLKSAGRRGIGGWERVRLAKCARLPFEHQLQHTVQRSVRMKEGQWFWSVEGVMLERFPMSL